MRLHSGPRLGLPFFGRSSRVVRLEAFRRSLHSDSRNRVSSLWIPSSRNKSERTKWEDTTSLLTNAGFLRQTSSGVFHMLPMGLRVQEKLERLIDKHMRSVGAAKLSLSSLSKQSLWKESGRLGNDSEVFGFESRRGTPYILAPTHEEEITNLLSQYPISYRDLPLRLYQITRKYRDEPRPRQGLLRAREFLMKDLYTFDQNVPNAMETYNAVKAAYVRIFDELKIPYLVAAADSGNMGGTLSHEFHVSSEKGDDTVIACSSCEHTFNEEIVDGKARQMATPEPKKSGEPQTSHANLGHTYFISKDRKTLVRTFYPKHLTIQQESDAKHRQVNPHAVASIVRSYGTELGLDVGDPLNAWTKAMQKFKSSKVEGADSSDTDPGFFVVDLFDSRVREAQGQIPEFDKPVPFAPKFICVDKYSGTNEPLDILRIESGDSCSQCEEGTVKIRKSTELAHTFYLGKRYTEVFGANVAVSPAQLKSEKDKKFVPMEMGCYGIGVSRIISAVASELSDSKGLNWPRVMAPFEVMMINFHGLEEDAEKIYDTLVARTGGQTDVVLDDRDKTPGWKLHDADLIGYPIIVVLGRSWTEDKKVEVQCRRLNLRTTASAEELPDLITSVLGKL